MTRSIRMPGKECRRSDYQPITQLPRLYIDGSKQTLLEYPRSR